MAKRPGFNPKITIDTERAILIGIVVLVFVFVFSMPLIYNFFTDLKNGKLFKKNDVQEVNNGNNTNTNNQTNNQDNNVKPIGDSQLVCTFTDSTVGGNKTDTYTFYYTDTSLKSLKMVSAYDAATDDYLNYIYSERSRYNNLKSLYGSISGFSANASLGNNTLTGTIILDLSKVNISALKNEDEDLSVDIDVAYNQDINEINALYINKGYSCR